VHDRLLTLAAIELRKEDPVNNPVNFITTWSAEESYWRIYGACIRVTDDLRNIVELLERERIDPTVWDLLSREK